ncbi:nuclear transport factor 2 family protein [Clostridium beijerinckii]|nr:MULTISPECIES: nuclear transport factor 2 family protein [Clostridium]MBN7586104.1 nuclear transport factor 2 family protein [Clostridium beijerinckii]
MIIIIRNEGTDMLFEKLETSTVNVMLDKFAVRELIEFERFCRDNALWDQMHECYTKDSTVTVSWYKGDGHGFVNASSKMKTVAPHKLNNTLVWLNDGKAAAVCMASIQTRKEINGVKMDLTSYVRLVYTIVKEDSHWKIASMEAIYEKDCLIPASPEDMKPNPNSRDSYANLSKVIGSDGYEIDQDLAGDDRPELREALLARVENWLVNSSTKM